MAVEGFILLYSLTLLQVYNGEGDAVMMLDDLGASRNVMLSKKKDTAVGGQGVFVEVILSFLGNPRTLFHKIGEEAFSIFVSEIRSDGLASLMDILDTEESLEGQQELFNQDNDDVDDIESGDGSGDDSDVEMIESEPQESEDDVSNESKSEAASESGSDGDDDEDDSQDDAELIQFNNLLAMTLQTSMPKLTGRCWRRVV